MTVATTTNKVSYTGNGVTTLFAFSIPFIAASDLQVYVAGVLKTLTTDYTISGSAPYPSGANVTFVVAPANLAAVLLVRTRPYTQTLDLVPNDPLPADTVEQLLGDHMVMLIQQLKEITDRSFALPITDTSGASVVIPTPVASQFLGWNLAGTALQNYAAVSGVATTSYWAAILATIADIHLYAGVATGTTNALTATTSPTFTPVAGVSVTVKASATNTTAATFGLNGQTATNLRVCGVGGLVALAGGEIVNGQSYDLFYDGTVWIVLDPSVEITQSPGDNTRARANTAFVTAAIAAAVSVTAATVQTKLSGSGTYTTPANCKRIRVRMVGGGGGGGGTGVTTAPTGATGGTTTFNSINALGGVGGSGSTTVNGQAGGVGGGTGTPGTGTATYRASGYSGAPGPTAFTGSGAVASGLGGGSLLGGGANGQFQTGAGNTANPNSGGGGSGGGATNGSTFSPGGGGGGEYAEIIITSPSASYSFTVGAGGAGGIGTGTNAQTGGAGGSGVIIVEEYYNT